MSEAVARVGRGTPAVKEPLPIVLQVSPRRVVLPLSLIMGILFFCSVAGQICRLYFNTPTMLGFVPMFYVGNEQNVPTWYSSVTLLASASLFAVAARAEWRNGRFAPYWLGLAVIFIALSIDEVASIHERTSEPVGCGLSVILRASGPRPGLLPASQAWRWLD